MKTVEAIVLRDTGYVNPILTDCARDLYQVGLDEAADLLDEAIDRILEARALIREAER